MAEWSAATPTAADSDPVPAHRVAGRAVAAADRPRRHGALPPGGTTVAILLIVLFVGLDVATLLAVPARRRRVERLRAALGPDD